MATAYRFIIEQRVVETGGSARGGGTVAGSRKTPSKKGANTGNLLGGSKGGVEHNRKMRAINPVLNKATHGLAEKGIRVARAGAGILKFDEEGNLSGVSGTSVTILTALLLREVMKMQFNWIEQSRNMNSQNFKAMENGQGAIRGEYEIAVNILNGRASYNQNK